MRLRRVIAAFQREEASESRRMKNVEKEKAKEQQKLEKLRQKEERIQEKQRQKQQESSNRWSKKNKNDFFRTIMSFGVENVPGDPVIRWTRFKEIAGLQKKTDESLDLYYRKLIAACEDVVKREANAPAPAPAPAALPPPPPPPATITATAELKSPAMTVTTPSGQSIDVSRESSLEPVPSALGRESPSIADQDNDQDNDERHEVEIISLDKAKRLLKRVDSMKTIREIIMPHPDLNDFLSNAKKTSGLPKYVWFHSFLSAI